VYSIVYKTLCTRVCMGLLWLVGSIKLKVSFAKEPYKRDNILQKRLIIFFDPNNRSHPIRDPVYDIVYKTYEKVLFPRSKGETLRK